MPGPIAFLLLVLGGFGLGILFFGGLWFTVCALPKSRHPAVLVLASFWVRTAVVIAGLLFAMDGLWQRALACLLGFLLARIVLSRWIPRDNPAGRGVV
jgi:F1F0 ATPase subunit 2